MAEIAIVTWAWDEAVRVQSYRLIAEAAGLSATLVQPERPSR